MIDILDEKAAAWRRLAERTDAIQQNARWMCLLDIDAAVRGGLWLAERGRLTQVGSYVSAIGDPQSCEAPWAGVRLLPSDPREAATVVEGHQRLAKARAAIEVADYTGARQWLDATAKIEWEAFALARRYVEGLLAQQKSDFQTASDIFKEVATGATAAKLEHLAIESALAVAECELMLHKPEQAEGWLRPLLSEVKRLGQRAMLVQALNLQAKLLVRLGHFDQGQAVIAELTKEAGETAKWRALASERAGELASFQNRISDAYEHFQAAYDATLLDEPHTHPRTLRAMARVSSTLVALNRLDEVESVLRDAMDAGAPPRELQHIFISLAFGRSQSEDAFNADQVLDAIDPRDIAVKNANAYAMTIAAVWPAVGRCHQVFEVLAALRGKVEDATSHEYVKLQLREVIALARCGQRQAARKAAFSLLESAPTWSRDVATAYTYESVASAMIEAEAPEAALELVSNPLWEQRGLAALMIGELDKAAAFYCAVEPAELPVVYEHHSFHAALTQLLRGLDNCTLAKDTSGKDVKDGT